VERHREPDSLGSGQGCGLIGFGEDDAEFLTAVASNKIGGRHRFAQYLGERGQHTITHLM